MFGSGFGSRTTSAFGQTSTFGKPATSFPTPGFGTTNTSLFGQSSQPTTSLFGSTAPTFGQTTTTQSFGGFGSSSGPSLFGSQQTTAGTSGGLFGSQNTNANTTGGGLFGSTAQTGFGTNSSFNTFGSASTGAGLFGQQQQQQQTTAQSTSLFGQSNPSGSGLFGTPTSTFSLNSAPTGTTIKFNPLTGTDSLVKNGVQQTIQIKHHCITCMKEYEGKSLEELRFEDYLANRKGPSQGASTGTGIFGNTGQTAPLFGSNVSTANTAGANIFGSSGFGQSSGVFGQPGSQSSNSLFGKPASTTPFGTTTTTQSTGFGSFGQGTNLFGVNANQAKPTFGASQPGTSIFGNTGTTGFGTQQSNFSFGSQPQQNQGIGLFQQNKFSGFGTQTTSNFTFGSNTNAANTTSLFGQKPPTTGFGIAPTTTVSAFGSSPFSSSTATGIGGNTIFSGGFNKSQTSGFPFGLNSTTPGTLGGSTLNSNSLFGNSMSKPGGNMFGNSGTSTGLFNSTGFGSTGSFGSATNTGFGGSNFGASAFNNASGSPLQNATAANVCDQIQVLSVIPYGNSPLYKHLRPTAGKTDDLLKPSVVPQKPNTDSNSYKVSTQVNNIVARKAHSCMEPSKKSLFDKIEEDIGESGFNQQRQSPRYLKIRPKSILNKSKIISSNEDQGVSNVSPATDMNKENIESYAVTGAETERSAAENNPPVISEASKNESAFEGNTMCELGAQKKSPVARKRVSFPLEDSSLHDASSSFANESVDEEKEDDPTDTSVKNHTCNVKLTRSDYFTVPSLSNLDEIVDDEGRCIVKNFTVGRHKYGNVTFYDAFDVAGLDLDEIVFFNHKEVEIYPNDDVKPPVGTGLNRRAQVTLDRVWPIDKTTREIIKSPDRLKQLNFIGKLKRASIKMNAQFIEYRALTGSWVFEVEHFSKYGLDDSDEDDAPKVSEKLTKNVPSKQAREPADLKNIFASRGFMNKKRGLDGKPVYSDLETANDFNLDENDEMMTLDEERLPLSFQKHPSPESEYMHEEFPSPVEKFSKMHDSSLHKVQLMKASFYVHDDISDPEISLEHGIPDLDLFATGRVDAYRSLVPPSKNVLPLIKAQFTSQFPPPIDIPVTDFAEEEYKPPYFSLEVKSLSTTSRMLLRPQRVAVKYRNSVFPIEKSIAKSVQSPLCDAGLYFGQHFRIGWSKGLSLTCLSTAFCSEIVMENQVDQLSRLFAGRRGNDYSPNVVNKLQLTTRLSEEFQKSMENHLDICLRGSKVSCDEGFPILRPDNGVAIVHEHCEVEQQTVRMEENYDRQVWELMVALWGNIPGLDDSCEIQSHKNRMLRKVALSEWLKTIVSAVDEEELNVADHVSSILSYLSRGKVHEACELAIKNDDFNLALLMSQIGGNEVTRSLMEQQLKQWHESEADQLIDVGRLKVITLVAGHMLYFSSKSVINTCENLDWKRAFALHLWYITRPSDSLVEALLQYESAYKLEEKFAAPPEPAYVKDSLKFETRDGHAPEDLCYHLLKLYSRRSYPLETVLNPITYTANVLDYRLSWFVMIALKNLGYDHVSEETEYIVHTSFAAQLEINSLWHWAVFVLLHIKDVSSRMNCVKTMIDKNVRLLADGTIGLTDEEKFVNEKLQVPAEWLFYSKAILAFSLNKFEEAAWYYINAKRWNEAHDIIINHLLTKAIINEKYDTLRNLINEIVASECILSGWNYRGAIISDYLNIVENVNLMISDPPSDSSFLESLQPLLSSVCTKVKFFPTATAKERLCQAEISKRIIQLIRVILNIQFGKRGMSIRFIVSLVDQLPLPEDYKQQELQEIISWWIDK